MVSLSVLPLWGAPAWLYKGSQVGFTCFLVLYSKSCFMGFFGPARWAVDWIAPGIPMIGDPKGISPSVAPECLVDSKNRAETKSSMLSRHSRRRCDRLSRWRRSRCSRSRCGYVGYHCSNGCAVLFLKRIVIEIRLQPLRAHRGCFSRQCFD